MDEPKQSLLNLNFDIRDDSYVGFLEEFEDFVPSDTKYFTPAAYTSAYGSGNLRPGLRWGNVMCKTRAGEYIVDTGGGASGCYHVKESQIKQIREQK